MKHDDKTLATKHDLQVAKEVLGKRLDVHDEQFQVVLTYVDDRFNKVDERFDRVDDRFDSLELRMDQVDERFDHLDERFDRLEKFLYVRESNANTLRKLGKRVIKIESYLQMNF